MYGQNETIYSDSVLSNILQLLSKMDTRLNSIGKKVTKSVDELDETKTSIKSVTQKVSYSRKGGNKLKQQYTEIDLIY